MSNESSWNTSLTITGLNALSAEGVVSSGPYTAKLLGWSDEEVAARSFGSLVNAIRWLTDAVANGALAKIASIYSPKGELVWTERGAPSAQLREKAMKQNAQRIFLQSVGGQESPTEIAADDVPLAPR